MRGPGSLIGDLPGTGFETEHRDDAFLFFEAALHMERLPRTAFFPLGEAGGEFADRSQSGTLDIAGPRTAADSDRREG